ncbi:MAG: ribose 5-phosphate isomerase A [Legionella sp. 40-6]|nr:ribose-5-phosphate isomerase RpiA [Legionella sp.]OJY58453.1 MAG: ribose 5-phosphate isomerase A [Legionella sp. 40-6]
MNDLKHKVAQAVLDYIEPDMVFGVGTGTTVNYLIKELGKIKHKIDACVASSKATEALLKAEGIPVIDLNATYELSLYIDGADEVTSAGTMIKGGGGAQTREKIVATVAKQFICIVDESKVVTNLGAFPIAVEVLPMARSLVARQIVQLGGDPEYREAFVTDNGNQILDVYGMELHDPAALEMQIKTLCGVVENGIFAHRRADIILVAAHDGVSRLK